MNERWEQFTRIWMKGKQNSTVMSIMSKVSVRGLEPNEDNCRDYYMGYIRYYIDAMSGNGEHLNPRKNKIKMKALRRNKNAKEQGRYSKGKPSHKMGRRHTQKKRQIQRR